MPGIPVSQSRTSLTDLVLPPDTNHHHTIFGGRVMAYVDKIACIAAMRHCRKPVVTVSSDSFDFLAPIKTGEAINLEAYVTSTYRTSMEIANITLSFHNILCYSTIIKPYIVYFVVCLPRIPASA